MSTFQRAARVAALLLVTSAIGCGSDGATGPASTATGGMGTGGGSAGAGAASGGSGGAGIDGAWLDIHLHCGPPSAACSQTNLEACCPTEIWHDLASSNGPGRGIVLSTEHQAVAAEVGDTVPPESTGQYLLNEITAAGAAQEPLLDFFASLECWHDTDFDDPGWADACKEDVDRWIASGAKGFKDHIGKQFDHRGDRDYVRWLGTWNRRNGFCAPAAGTADPSDECMHEATVRYPALEPAWREVLSYITETRGYPVVTHATSYPGPEQCYDPVTSDIDGCAAVTRRHLIALGHWLEENVSVAARRRIIVAHLGFYAAAPPDPAGFVELLATGVSSDTGATLDILSQAGCAARSVLAAFPDQILFGTDYTTNQACAINMYQAWRHVLTADFGVAANFEVCWGQGSVQGLGLGTPHVDGCPDDLPADILGKLVRDNALALLPE